MTERVFRAALAHSSGYVTIGGGEPTIHPKFEKFLLLAMSESDDGGVYIITNGKHKARAHMIFQLAKSGLIGAELSLDEYHEWIDQETVDEWSEEVERVRMVRRRCGEDRSLVGIRNTTENRPPVANGRARTELGFEKGEDYVCPCDGPIVKPNGDVMLCGCDDSIKIGDVFRGFSGPEAIQDFGEWCVRSMQPEACEA